MDNKNCCIICGCEFKEDEDYCRNCGAFKIPEELADVFESSKCRRNSFIPMEEKQNTNNNQEARLRNAKKELMMQTLYGPPDDEDEEYRNIRKKNSMSTSIKNTIEKSLRKLKKNCNPKDED